MIALSLDGLLGMIAPPHSVTIAMQTTYITHPLCLKHDMGAQHSFYPYVGADSGNEHMINVPLLAAPPAHRLGAEGRL